MPIDEPETEEINELELTSPEIESLPNDTGDSSLTPSSSEIDLEYRPISQLRALAIIFGLYLMMWTCGAFAIALPFPHYIPNQAIIFTYSYAFFATILALFLFVYYCLGRHDARMCWHRFCCCVRRPVYIVNGGIRGNSNNIVHANGHVLRSSSSLDSQWTQKSNSTSNRSNPLKNYPKKQSNINLVPSQTGTDHTLSSIQEYPSFYNPKQNGVAKKYWEKKSKNKQINALLKEKNSLRSGSQSSFTTDNRSNVEENHSSHNNNYRNESQKSASNNGSEINTHLSIEVAPTQKLCNKPPSNASSLSPKRHSPKALNFDPPAYNSLPRPMKTYSPLTVQTDGVSMGPTRMRNSASPPLNGVHITPIVRPHPVMGLPGGSLYQPRLFPYNPSPMPPPMQPEGVIDYPSIPPPPSYGINLNPVVVNNLNEAKIQAQIHSNSLPRLGKGGLSGGTHALGIQRNGSVPRLRDIDGGESESSQGDPRRPSINTEIKNMQMYKPPEPPVVTPPAKHRDINGQPCECIDGSCDPDLIEELSESEPMKSSVGTGKRGHNGHGASSDCGGSVSSSRRRKKKCESFMDELEQRIPNNRTSPCSSLNRSHSGGMERQNRSSNSRPNSMSQDSDGGHLEPILQGSLKRDRDRNRRSKSHDPATMNQRHSNTSNNTASDIAPSNKEQSRNSRNSRRPKKDWDTEFRDKPRKTNSSYAYVNHNYQEKVLTKLIQQSSNGLIDPIARGLSWFPRSVSAYEQVNSEPTDLPDESSSSSSSDDSTEDIWVLQKRRKKFKKETSV